VAKSSVLRPKVVIAHAKVTTREVKDPTHEAKVPAHESKAPVVLVQANTVLQIDIEHHFMTGLASVWVDTSTTNGMRFCCARLLVINLRPSWCLRVNIGFECESNPRLIPMINPALSPTRSFKAPACFGLFAARKARYYNWLCKKRVTSRMDHLILNTTLHSK